ncbi:hypothetical protein Y1Q_0011231 [Alligator mississippiensis]|uniref:Uncharacterized protein n=1 Tax=Alligator mississippiensis TaxID=8496 RepID=A0A151N0M0_ALLMI|nr:hypothetical protein Y1Q_0011231 [Alligator mississippiensis]
MEEEEIPATPLQAAAGGRRPPPQPPASPDSTARIQPHHAPEQGSALLPVLSREMLGEILQGICTCSFQSWAAWGQGRRAAPYPDSPQALRYQSSRPQLSHRGQRLALLRR